MAERRGRLRIYLGAAPGVGKTYAMLNEGWRRKQRGTDVVVGFVETHGRPTTAEQLRDLEVVPRRTIEYRDTTFEEMDVDALVARKPEQVLVDELAHTNVPGSRNEKRWQDIHEILDAGIDVISTVNIQHLESINDVVERITGIVQRETVPDHVVRDADQIELVDMSPEALRRRMAHGNIYAAEKIDAALANYFRAGNLGALRELALLWVADRVDDALEEYRERHGITEPWETRERVIVAITGAPGSEQLIRRAARIAQRTHGELLGVHVQSDTGLASFSSERVAEHRRLLEQLGGEYREATGADVAAALIDVARAENGTQIVLGASRRSRWQELTQGSIINRVVRRAGRIDVHVISAEPASDEEAARQLPRPRLRLSPVPPRRQAIGWALAVIGLPLLTLVLTNLRDHIGLPSVLLLYLVLVMAVAVVGGVFPALAAAAGGFLLANWYFTPPFHELTVAAAEELLALLVYLFAAGTVSALVDRVGRSRLEAARARAEAEAMAGVAGSLAEAEAMPVLVGRLRTTFGMQSAALFRRDGDGWRLEASAGAPVPATPDDADVVKELDADTRLTLSGGRLAAEDHRVLNALAAQLGTAVETERLQLEAARATSLAEANDLRAALLQAVSHDLRTPLASIKASITSLRQHDIAWSEQEIEDFEAMIEDATDRMTSLVVNLLDMSRIQSGTVMPRLVDVGLDEVVPAALASLGPRGRGVDMRVPEDLAAVRADPALLERVVANLVDNAITHSDDGTPVRVEAGCVSGRALLRVVDRGPGIPLAEQEHVFEPFLRLGDDELRAGAGLGLGLPVARGFVTAMGGELYIEDTPGGGTTMVVSLEAVAEEMRT
jgi:two-component system sensor histidine kinase KdpD